MKSYIGTRTSAFGCPHAVVMDEHHAAVGLPLRMRHQSENLNWGPHASEIEMADLAYDLLYDCLGFARAEKLHDAFMWNFVCKWTEVWTIDEDEIVEWAAATEKEAVPC